VSRHNIVLRIVSGADGVIGRSRPGRPAAPASLDSTAGARESGIDWGYAVRMTRALLGL
jgi:hypothetical protein